MKVRKCAVSSVGFAVLAVVVAGWGSGTMDSGSSSSAPAPATAQAAATVQSHPGPLGEYPVDGAGFTLVGRV